MVWWTTNGQFENCPIIDHWQQFLMVNFKSAWTMAKIIFLKHHTACSNATVFFASTWLHGLIDYAPISKILHKWSHHYLFSDKRWRDEEMLTWKHNLHDSNKFYSLFHSTWLPSNILLALNFNNIFHCSAFYSLCRQVYISFVYNYDTETAEAITYVIYKHLIKTEPEQSLS